MCIQVFLMLLMSVRSHFHVRMRAIETSLCFRMKCPRSTGHIYFWGSSRGFHIEPVIADRGYDMNNILELIEKQQAIAVIPSRKHRKVQRKCDWWLYKERHLVECLFNKLEHYRRIATRYDKLTCTFAAFLSLTSILL